MTGAQAQDNLAQTSIAGLMSHNRQQITSLAGAFPQELYAWRPAEGVRSVSETLMHVAGANYYIGSKLGFVPPTDVDVMGLEKITDKDQVMAELGKSFDYVTEMISKVPTADFGQEVDLGFAKLNRLSSLMVILEHSGEHKGQLIAYARSNGIIPPWSQGQ